MFAHEGEYSVALTREFPILRMTISRFARSAAIVVRRARRRCLFDDKRYSQHNPSGRELSLSK